MLREEFPFDDPGVEIALVGADGFIGSHLIRAILERTAWRIFAVDLDFHRLADLRTNERIVFLPADIADASVIERVASSPLVVNLAAICTPGRYMTETRAVIESNFTRPAALADAVARSGGWLVYFSTSEVYGKTAADSTELEEDSSPFVLGSVRATRWSYAVAKQLSERYIAAIPGLRWSVVRPFNFIGPWMDFVPGVDGDGIPRVLAGFSSALLRNCPIPLVNGGLARRTFTSVHDAVDFLFCLFANPEKSRSQAFNVGNAQNEIAILDLAHLMRQVYAQINEIPVKEIPNPETVSAESFYGAGYEDSLRRVPSVEKARCLLGFTAKIPLQDAIEESLRWFISHYGRLG